MLIGCFKCGKMHKMEMLRMHSDGQHLVCRTCLGEKGEAKQKLGPKQEEMKSRASRELAKYYCKACNYSFTRNNDVVVDRCPYCDNANSVVIKS